MEGSEAFPERERETKPKTYTFKELSLDQTTEAEPEPTSDPENNPDAAVRRAVYWFGQAMIYRAEIQRCNKGLNRLNRQNKRLKREKAKLAIIVGENVLTQKTQAASIRVLIQSNERLCIDLAAAQQASL